MPAPDESPSPAREDENADATPGLAGNLAPGPAPELAPLPPVRGGGLAHVVIPGTALWLVGLIVLVVLIPTLRAHDALLWLWTALAGFLLGFVGLAIYGWQRAAARRGSRGASQMALEEHIGHRR